MQWFATAASHGASCPTPAHTTPHPASAAFSKKPAEAQLGQRNGVCASSCGVFFSWLQNLPNPSKWHSVAYQNHGMMILHPVLAMDLGQWIMHYSAWRLLENRLLCIYSVVGFELLLIPNWSKCCTVSSNFLRHLVSLKDLSKNWREHIFCKVMLISINPCSEVHH